MNQKEKPEQLGYFRLSLMEFLRTSHPQRVDDENFIRIRTQSALDAYEEAVGNGFNPLQAEELANVTLFQNLHFSKFDVLVNLIWEEFSDLVPAYGARAFALKILPECEEIFNRYDGDDDFACCSPEYDFLYRELVDFIRVKTENGELKVENS